MGSACVFVRWAIFFFGMFPELRVCYCLVEGGVVGWVWGVGVVYVFFLFFWCGWAGGFGG